MKRNRKKSNSLPLSSILQKRFERLDRRIRREATTISAEEFETRLSNLDEIVRLDLTELLTEHLGTKYRIGSGKIIDQSGEISDHFDLVISKEPSISLTLAFDKSSNYIPYDTVYAVSDIRTFLRREDLEDFCTKIEKLESKLYRSKTSAKVIRSEREFTLTTADPYQDNHYRNPLFSFFFALISSPNLCPQNWTKEEVNSSLALAYLSGFYQNFSSTPSMVTALDRFCIAPFYLELNEEKNSWNSIGLIWAHQHLVDESDCANNYRWLMYYPAKNVRVSNYALLLTTLAIHLQECVLNTVRIAEFLDLKSDAFEGLVSLRPIEKT